MEKKSESESETNAKVVFIDSNYNTYNSQSSESNSKVVESHRTSINKV